MASVWNAVLFPYRLTYITVLNAFGVSGPGVREVCATGGNLHGLTGVDKRSHDLYGVLDGDLESGCRGDCVVVCFSICSSVRL